MLYYCPTCGHWQIVGFLHALSTFVDSFTKALDQKPLEQLGFLCPNGHGLMMQVLSTDRISVRLEPMEGDARTLTLIKSEDQQEGETVDG